uniref:Uncharacterized protein n=1 Tax=Acrobeloides nanus TaxID=290746 RepID=A0A914DFF7_9BILA
IFMNNSNRAELLIDVQDVIGKTDITVDKSCLIDKNTVCRRVTHATRVSASGNQLIRSCTTTD